MTQEPDFSIKKLSEYSTEELIQLYRGVQSALQQAKEWGRDEDANILDIWSYRIRDAVKISKEDL